MSCHARAARDRCLVLERLIADRFSSGSIGLDDAVDLFDELLLVARPASVRALTKLLTRRLSREQQGPLNLCCALRLPLQPDGPCLPQQGSP
jgi:hypothetical protein